MEIRYLNPLTDKEIELLSGIKTYYLTPAEIKQKFGNVMEQQKYFTPTLEDLFLGYECEVKNKGIWTEFIAGRDRELNYLFNYMKEVRMDGCQVRTPYLTPEQIEKEGWKYLDRDWNHIPKRTSFEKDNYFLILDFNQEIPTICLIFKDPSLGYDKFTYPEHFRVEIPCPSINEFRKISKLLNIK